MANIVDSSVDPLSGSKSYSIWKIALVGISLGILYWFFTVLTLRFTGSIYISGNISTILIATLGIVIMLNLHMARPLLVALASAISLWGLSEFTNGLSWYETISWSALLYGLTYTLFLWITRYRKNTPVIIAIIVIVIIVRVVLTL